MNKKALSEQEWVYDYVRNRQDPLPLVLGTRGTWGVSGKKSIILVAFTLPDIIVLRDLHNAAQNPIRKMTYKDIVYFAVNIVDKKQVESVMDDWKER